jgi:hypothetical protein
MITSSCNYIHFSDLAELMTEDEYGELSEGLSNSSDITFGDADKTLISLRRMCDLIRDTFDEDRGDELADKLSAELHYNDYIDVEH